MTITLAFEFRQDVVIRDLNLPGRITSIQVAEFGSRYEVGYLYNGQMNYAYFYEDHLQNKEPKNGSKL